MATGFSGRKLLLKRAGNNSPTVFTTIAALTANHITETEQAVDTTTKDDAGKRTLLSGNILLAMSLSATGIFTDNATIAGLRTDMRAGTHRQYKIDLVDTDATVAGGNYIGAFRITSLEIAGENNGVVNYTIALESDGAIAFATT